MATAVFCVILPVSLLMSVQRMAVSVIFPAITTYKALNSNNHQQLKSLSIYWLVLSCFTIVDFQLFFVSRYFPLYSFIKLYISFWLVLPNTKGAEYIYYNLVDPFLTQHLGSFEHWMDDFKLGDFASTLFARITDCANSTSKSVSDAEQKEGIFGEFVEGLYKEGSQSKSKRNQNLLNSLLGVLQAFPVKTSDKKTSITASSSITQSSSELLSPTVNKAESFTTENTSIDNDFDVVNTNDIEDFKSDDKEETTADVPSDGWLSFWSSQSKKKAA